jgi:beta-glucuronidase
MLSPVSSKHLCRNYLNLDGRWHYIVDVYETGFRGFQGARADEEENLGGFFENKQQQSKSELIEYNFDKSPTLNVPGDWNSQDEKLLYFEGTVWYQRSFNFHPQADKRYFLRFNAINYDAYVSLNDKRLGVHAGGFTPFEFEVTKQLQDGNNFIVVKVTIPVIKKMCRPIILTGGIMEALREMFYWLKCHQLSLKIIKYSLQKMI